MVTNHVIIGSGPVATNAIESIRQFDRNRSNITLISDEPAHSRMALPYWLAGDITRDHTLTGDEESFKKLRVKTRIGCRVTKIDPKANMVSIEDGDPVTFDNLLIATGSTPIGLPIPGVDLPGVQPLWTLDHTKSAMETTKGKSKPRVVMIGSGFIGFIMLNAMYKRDWQLAVVEREEQVLPRMLNTQAAKIVGNWVQSKGVELQLGTTIKQISKSNNTKVVELADGQKLEADLVVIATGVQPNVGLLAGSGIEATEGPDGGIPVNDRMQTNFPHIYAGGDVAKGPVMFSDKRHIHAIQPTAVDHGRIAGTNMAGKETHYPGSLSMNVLDACGLQCASFGNWSDSNTEAMTISNPDGYVFRSLLWSDDQITGALFVGRANDLGMLTDVGMVKGIMQTETKMGDWKSFLQKNPFDIRRPYIATGVARKLAGTTLVGQPSRTRQYQFDGAESAGPDRQAHEVYVGTKGN